MLEIVIKGQGNFGGYYFTT